MAKRPFIQYRQKGSINWITWSDSSMHFNGSWMTTEEAQRVIDHHNAVYQNSEFRLVTRDE